MTYESTNVYKIENQNKSNKKNKVDTKLKKIKKEIIIITNPSKTQNKPTGVGGKNGRRKRKKKRQRREREGAEEMNPKLQEAYAFLNELALGLDLRP